MNFEPVRTLADLESLNLEDVVEGYTTTQRGDPEPGPNRGRAFWHGWRNRMIDYGEMAHDEATAQLAAEVVSANRTRTFGQEASNDQVGS